MKPINLKRVYDDVANNDGYRVLIDKLWPRGVSKEDAQLDEWLKDIAPSDELRRWFDHDPNRFEEFKKRYKKELESSKEELDKLLEKAKRKKVTLLYAATDTEMNNAMVVKEVLEE